MTVHPTGNELAIDFEMTMNGNGIPDGGDFGNPKYFQMFAAGVGFRDENGNVETDVLFRSEDTPESELDFIASVMDWVEARDPDVVYTFNGTDFDFPQLRGRTRKAIQGANKSLTTLERVETFLSDTEHIDLKDDSWDVFGDYTSLDDTAAKMGVPMPETRWDDYNHGLNPSDWREERHRGKDVVTGGDMPGVAEHMFRFHAEGQTDTEQYREVRQLVYDYTASDVEPLFKLADKRPFEKVVEA